MVEKADHQCNVMHATTGEDYGMNRKLKLPTRIENFEEIRTAGFYYVDKTGFIRDLDSDIDNLWSLLFTTGYLTQCSDIDTEPTDLDDADSELTKLVIPNKEIHWIFVQQIHNWFKAETQKDIPRLETFCRAFAENDVTAIEEGFTAYLKKTISIRDTHTRKEMKENFYHGILLGLFGNMDDRSVQSNAEAGDGYSDIAVAILDKDIGIIIELKYAENAQFDAACREALKQIENRNYEELLIDDGMKTIYKYGIACYKNAVRLLPHKI